MDTLNTPQNKSESQKAKEIKMLAEMFDYTPFMIEELMKNYPQDYRAVLKAFDQPAINTIRVNILKPNYETLKERLEQKGFHLRPTEFVENAFHLQSQNTKLSLGATHEYLRGEYYLQSLGSMIPVKMLNPQPGDNILDMCAAPGSKTTQMGELMHNEGILMAVDRKGSRLQSLQFNIKRMGIENSIVFQFDSRQLKPNLLANFKPNKILLDAPCTGSGIIRSDPTRKKSRTIADVKKMAKVQKELLENGLNLLQSGGFLLYSTCSFHYQENEQVVAETLPKFNDVELIEPIDPIGIPGFDKIDNLDFGYEMLKTRRLYPNLQDTDAFFYALFQKN